MADADSEMSLSNVSVVTVAGSSDGSMKQELEKASKHTQQTCSLLNFVRDILQLDCSPIQDLPQCCNLVVFHGDSAVYTRGMISLRSYRLQTGVEIAVVGVGILGIEVGGIFAGQKQSR